MGQGPRLTILVAGCAIPILACALGGHPQERLLRELVDDRAAHLDRDERSDIVRALAVAERRTGVDALLLLAMIEEESHFRPRARSRRGALGLLQLRTATARDVAERHGLAWKGESSLLEPRLNILIGATYLSELHTRFGSWDVALTAYNRGPTRTGRRAKRRNPSSHYAARVLERYESWRGEPE